eukprot:Skav232626  [mRNA]  locus=scaffold12:90479:94758:+ [translate_table: standard]
MATAAKRPALDLTRAELGLAALKRQFPHLEADALAVFLEADGEVLSDDSLAALMDGGAGLRGRWWNQQHPVEPGIRAAVVLPTGEVLALRVADGPILERQSRGSPLGEYGEALDLFNDAYDWVWDGSWTNELEESVLNLLVAMDDTFSSTGGTPT